MKNYCSFLFYYFQLLYSQKKVYYTEDFKELSTAEGAAYSTYEDDKEGTTRSTYFIDGTKQLRSIFKFQNVF
jgi:protein TonB